MAERHEDDISIDNASVLYSRQILQESDVESSSDFTTGFDRPTLRYQPDQHQEREFAPAEGPHGELLGREYKEGIQECASIDGADHAEHESVQAVGTGSCEIHTGFDSTRQIFLSPADEENIEVPVQPLPNHNSGSEPFSARATSPPPNAHRLSMEEATPREGLEHLEGLALPKSTSESTPKSKRQPLQDNSVSNSGRYKVLPVPAAYMYNNIPSPYVRAHDGDQKPRLVRYPHFGQLEARLKTYDGWPHKSPSPRDLARAGMFYNGMNDEVCCYRCGNYMHSFQSNDDPAEEHSKHFPDCSRTHWVE